MKNKILTLFGIGTLLLFIKFGPVVEYLFNNARDSFLTRNLELLFNSLLIFPIVLFFSIVTYRAPERVFAAWWKFARLSVPLLFAVSVVINLGYFHSDGGVLKMDDVVDQVLLSGVHLLFILGSIIQIIRGYRQK